MPVEPGLLDANILVYALDSSAPQHAASRAVLEAARSSDATFYVTSQVLCEFYAVVTDRRRVSVPRSPAEAIAAISDILALPGILVLAAPVEVVRRWLTLAGRSSVVGGGIFDLQIVATMQAHGVDRIYTYNLIDVNGTRNSL